MAWFDGDYWYEGYWWDGDWWAGQLTPVDAGEDGYLLNLYLCQMRKQRKRKQEPDAECARRQPPPLAVLMAALEDE